MYDEQDAREVVPEWVVKPTGFSEELTKALIDPLAFKRRVIEINVDILRRTIEILEQSIVTAREDIEKTRKQLVEAEAKQARHAQQYSKLKPGQKIPRGLLPTKTDLKWHARRHGHESRLYEHKLTDIIGDVEGWNFGMPKYGPEAISVVADRKRSLTSEQHEKIMLILALPEYAKTRPFDVSIDRAGRVKASYAIGFKRPDLKGANIQKFALESIDAYAKRWEQGEVQPGRLAEVAIDLHRRIDEVRPPEVRALKGLDQYEMFMRDEDGMHVRYRHDGWSRHMLSQIFGPNTS